MSSVGPTGNKVFAPTIFFIAFREALEAALVIGILLGMLESLVRDTTATPEASEAGSISQGSTEAGELDPQGARARELRHKEKADLIKKLRRQIFAGAFSGLFVAFAIGAAFLAVFYTQANNLWGRAEELWEGIFTLVAVCLITPMSLAILRADRSRAKWRRKLQEAFNNAAPARSSKAVADGTVSPTLEKTPSGHASDKDQAPETPIETAQLPTVAAHGHLAGDLLVHEAEVPNANFFGRVKRRVTEPFRKSQRGALALFVIPFVTILREGLEGVVFIGGVSLGLPASSIPLPAIVGLAAGLLCGWIVFRVGSFSKVRIFLVASTCVLLLIGAGMASRSVSYLQMYRYVQLVGEGAAESGSGPGSYYWKDYVWHLNCCNPELKDTASTGWGVLNSLVGWNNTATIGSILAYIFYWLAVTSYLVYALWKEGRLSLSIPRKQGDLVLWECKGARLRRQRRQERLDAVAPAPQA